MPWTLDTPIASPHGDLTTVVVTDFIVSNVKKEIKVLFSEGLIENGKFAAKTYRNHPIRDTPAIINPMNGNEEVAAVTDFTDFALLSFVGPPKTRHDELKELWYQVLLDAGAIGPGVLS